MADETTEDIAQDEGHSLGQVTDCFLKFKIHNLDAEWMNSAAEGDLSELPDDFLAVHRKTNWASLLRDAADSIRQRGPDSRPPSSSLPLNSDETGEDEFWTELANNGISFRGVTVVTCCLIQRGSPQGASTEYLQYVDREVAMLAASLYLCIVSVPGCNAFRLFSPVLYEKALLMFRSANDILKAASGDARMPLSGRRRSKRGGDDQGCSSQASSADNPGTSSAGRQKRRNAEVNVAKSKARRRDDHDALFLLDDDDSSSMSSQLDDNDGGEAAAENEMVILTRHEVQSLIDLIASLASDLKRFLNTYSLKTCEQSLDLTVQLIGELLLVESKYPSWKLSHLTSQAFSVLKSICNPLHGVINDLVWIVLKYLMQAILSDASRKVATFVVQLAKEVPDGGALTGIRRFLQNICFKASEKADSRNKQCALTFFILDQLPVTAYAGVIKWLVAFACSAKVAHRLFILELFSLMLGRPSKEVAADEFHPDQMQFVSQACLMKTVLARCSDKASLVRAKALSVLASTTLSAEPNLHQLVVKMFVTPPVAARNSDGPDETVASRYSLNDDDDNEDGENSNTVCHAPAVRIADTETAIELLRQRTNDSKAQVRRAALQVLQSVVELHANCVTVVNVEAIQVHCRDSSLLVRKQAMQSVSDLLQRYPTMNLIQQAWLEGILPMILDPETTAQSKCMDSVQDIILQNIVTAAKSSESFHHMAWNILNQIANSRSNDSRHFLRKAIYALANQGKLKTGLVDALKTHIETNNNAVAWLMLSTVAPCMTINNTDFIMSYWEKHQIDGPDNVLQYVLIVMGEVAHTFDIAKRGSIMGQLAALMSEFRHQSVVISEMITTMNLLAQSKDNENSDGEKIFTNCCKTIMKYCDNYLSSVFLNKKGKTADIDEERVVCYLFTVGELGLHCPAHVPKRVFLLMKSFLAAPSITNRNVETHEQPNSQETEGGTNTGHNYDRFYCSMVNKRIRRVAFLSLGKLCLQHETLAKQCIPALGKELECSEDPIIRNNVVIIMADLCKRYTTLVDEYIPNVTACLRDTSLVVRRQTLLLLTNLLQEDYLKWKGPLFFHYMSTLVDESPEMRSLAEYGLRQILDKRHPAMFQQHFVECLFHFNAYKNHEKYNKVILSEKDYQLFSMAGDNLRGKRMKLYKFMLENMGDENRFLVMTKTCQDILGGVLENSISITLPNGSPCPSGVGLLRDSFAILCCDEIKLATLRNIPLEDAEEDLEAIAVATAKKTVITQVVKKNAIENIVPIVISLKHKLEELRSPLIKDLMRYLKELMKDFKNEIKEILSADKLLATEIEYDLKMFEQENRMEIEQRKKEVLKQKRLKMQPSVIAGCSEHIAENAAQSSIVPVPANISMDNNDAHPPIELQGASRNENNTKNVVNLTTPDTIGIEPQPPTVGVKQPAPTDARESFVNVNRTSSAQSTSHSGSSSRAASLIRKSDHVQLSIPRLQLERIIHECSPQPLVPTSSQSVTPRRAEQAQSHATPKRPPANLRTELLRAISTPHGVVTDITFDEQNDGIPLSPILEMESSSIEMDRDAGTITKKVVLHVQSPEQHRAKKQWAVRPRK